LVELKEKMKFIDLFAGAGGLSLGLEQAGFEPVFVNEIDEKALKTYFSNRKKYFPDGLKNESSYLKDIESLTTEKLVEIDHYLSSKSAGKKSIDLIVGGPPCQGFSHMGYRRSHSVQKKDIPSNFLFLKMVEFVDFFQPKVFLFENVRGIKTSRWNGPQDKQTIFDDILQTFNKLEKYHVHDWELKAYDYGVPQNRPRVFVIGHRKDLGLPKDTFKAHPPVVIKPPPDLEVLLGDLEDPNYINGKETKEYTSKPNKVQKEYRKPKTSLLEHKYSGHKQEVIARFRAMIKLKNNETLTTKEKEILKDYKTNSKKFSQKVLSARWETKPNITVTSMPDDYIHYSLPRTLTVREWARLQGFPDYYVFYGKRTTGGIRRAGNPRKKIYNRELPKYTQIGNAVSVGVARAIGKYILKKIKKRS